MLMGMVKQINFLRCKIWPPTRPILYTFLLIGKDLSKKGIVEGGWSELKMVRNMELRRTGRGRLMEIIRDFGTRNSVVISARIISNRSPTSNTPSRKLELRFSHKKYLRKVIKSAKKYSGIESVTNKCEICSESSLAKKS